jgi:hypothetical protein
MTVLALESRSFASPPRGGFAFHTVPLAEGYVGPPGALLYGTVVQG